MKALRALLVVQALASVCLLSTCKIPGSEKVSDSDNPISTAIVTNYTGSFSYSLDVGSGSHDVYFVFSNKDLDMSSASATAKNSAGAIEVNGSTIAQSCAQPAGGPSASSTKARDLLARSLRDPVSMISSGSTSVSGSSAAKIGSISASVMGNDSDGDSMSLNCLASNTQDIYSAIPSHCRKVVSSVSTKQGARTLNIWVADDCWSGTPGTKAHLVTQGMVNALADRFLKAGYDNDIFDDDTDILGPEWGTPQGTYASQLIPFNSEITILLADIANDNSDKGGIVGYFQPGNNYYKSTWSGSNQRIMFVIDAVMFASPSTDGSTTSSTTDWSLSTPSYWAEECFSTLAHEFQHMIQFYRKGIVVRGDGDSADTWINEMCSQLMEDLVASNMGVKGPRGVAYNDPTAGSTGNVEGRIPLFNKYLSLNDRQLTKTDDYDVLDYSFSYAFGAWLMRNYGGAQFVKNVVYDSAVNEDCITNAVKAYSGQKLSLGDLIQRWAVAILGSGSTTMPVGYRLNTGAWVSSSAGGQTYQLGSINFFNYSPAPQVLSGKATSYSVQAASNVYYKAASSMTGSDKWTLTLPSKVAFSVYVTP